LILFDRKKLKRDSIREIGRKYLSINCLFNLKEFKIKCRVFAPVNVRVRLGLMGRRWLLRAVTQELGWKTAKDLAKRGKNKIFPT